MGIRIDPSELSTFDYSIVGKFEYLPALVSHVDPIICGCCCLLLLLLSAGGGASTHTTNTIVMTPYGPQTVTTKTTKSMSTLDWLALIFIGIILVPVGAGVLYVWANSL